MKQQRINTDHFYKFKATYKKIGRPTEGKDTKRAVTYTILMEYYTAMKQDIQEEPEYLPLKSGNDLLRNPNYELLDLIKQELDKLDREMRLSFYPKGI